MAEPEQSDKSALRELSPEEFAQILEGHQKWLSSGMSPGSGGKRADLSGCNLVGHNLLHAVLSHATLEGANVQGMDLGGAELIEANLIKADLRKAVLSDANLIRANLTEANLREVVSYKALLSEALLIRANLERAHLIKANLSDANLNGTNMRMAKISEVNLRGASLTGTTICNADLQDADLSEVRGLLAGQLAGANVSGAKLPGDIHKFEGLEQVKELSSSAKILFLGMLSACAYSWLTIATTTDVRLLTNSVSSPLPIIQTEIPIVGFYWVAPLLFLCVYLYFHLYLQRMWEALALLPAVFPDGTPLDRKAYPWLLNGLVRAHFIRLRSDRPPFSRLQVGISILLAWWLMPLTLCFFWFRYLTRHDWPGTYFHIGLLVIAIGCALMFQRLAKDTLQGREKKPFQWKEAYRDKRTYVRPATAVITAALASLLSLGAIDDHRGILPRILAVFRYDPFADISGEDISIKPTNWTGHRDREMEELALVKGAQLRQRDLRDLMAEDAFMAKADLSMADLERANLHRANLRGTFLFRANLQGADLSDGADFQVFGTTYPLGTNLEYASLSLANLQGANLNNVNLWRANLIGANLQGAFLIGANLQDANLSEANLQGSHLESANLSQVRGLTETQLGTACG